MPNRLALESSPYLLQHKDNPVDWFPWGEEALMKARAADKPILLSIGYSACHWCHVMEHESFEDPAVAALMNDLFVPIKVDREERPDLDAIYMEAVQRLTGQGGWPMTMFLFPDGRPFYGGTYFPPVDRQGMPSFTRVLRAVADTYSNRRQDLEENAGALAESLSVGVPRSGSGTLDLTILRRAAEAARGTFDPEEGGFGTAPKFPQPMLLEFLLRAHLRGDPAALEMVHTTLTRMAMGGMYDQIGGGFHRYSVDGAWLVPHFEKMLYDNAQLARIYADAFTLTGEPFYRRVAEETLHYVQREMTSPEGGFYSSQDADSEGEEGKFFLWTAEEVRAALGADAPVFMAAFDVSDAGNFEGKNILNRPRRLDEVAAEFRIDAQSLQRQLDAGKQVLFDAREKRVKPGRDEKILTAWNGLMLRAFANAARALGNDSFMASAQAAARFLLAAMRRDGRVLRTYRGGAAKLNGYLEDYAFLADGLIALYEAGGGSHWLTEAQTLADTMIAHFADPEGGPFFSTSDDHEQLITRPRDLYDNATPSGNSVAAEVLLRLAVHTGDDAYRVHAEAAITPLRDVLARHPQAFARLLCAVDFALAPPRELVIIGDPAAGDTGELLTPLARRFDPNLVLALAMPEEAARSTSPLLQGRVQRDGRATAYLCEHYACKAPVTEPGALLALLQ